MERKANGRFIAGFAGVILIATGAAIWLVASSAQEPTGETKNGTAHQAADTPMGATDQPGAIAWLTDYGKALTEAKATGKLVIVDFYATWCGPCQMMEQTTFVDERVRRRIQDFVALKIDVDQQKDVAARYGIRSLPTTAVIRSSGQPITGAAGYLDADRWLELIDSADKPDPAAQTAPAEPTLPERGIEGRAAPPLGVKTWFNLPEGHESVDLGDYRGKVVYLYGFQSWCPGCHKYGFPTLTKLIERYKGNDHVAFIAVQTAFEGFSTNSPEKARQTAERYGLTIPVGHSGSADDPSTVMRRYRTGGTPWTVIIDRAGVVRFNDYHIEVESAVELIDRLVADTAVSPE